MTTDPQPAQSNLPDPSVLVLESFETGRLLTVELMPDSTGPQTVTGVVTSLHLGSRSFDMAALRPWDLGAPYDDIYRGVGVRIGWETVRTVRPARIRLLVEVGPGDLTDREITTTAARLAHLQLPSAVLELRDGRTDGVGFRVRFLEITGLTDLPQEAGQ